MSESDQCIKLRSLVHDCLAKHLYESAIFFADKLVTLSGEGGVNGVPSVNTYSLAQALYIARQYRRALMLLKGSELIELDARCRYLAAKCLAECSEWEECLMMLGGWDDDNLPKIVAQDGAESSIPGEEISLFSAICLLRGKAYDALENQQRAIRWYKAALQADPLCYDAFRMLIDNHMLTSNEEFQLLQSLKFSPEHEWLQLLYRAKCKKYDQQATMKRTLDRLEAPLATSRGSRERSKSPDADATMPDAGTPTATPSPSQTPGFQLATAGLETADRVRTRSMAAKGSDGSPMVQTPEAGKEARGNSGDLATVSGCGLADNLDVLVCRAEWLYHLGAFQDCYQLTSSILKRDPYAIEVMPTHITSALELRKKNDLFIKAHRLVEEYSDRVIAWFAVACYYLCTNQYESARRYFSKATTMDPNFAPAWIGFGHAFAFQDESDQAMAAYRTAARLFPGLHWPLLGMGMEYQRMNNLALAEQLFMQGHAICPADPLLCNELGVLAFRNRHLDDAERWFLRAVDRIPNRISAAWEATLVNLGHTYRKQHRWEEAEAIYQKALGLCPGQPSTYAALGYTFHLQGRLQPAIINYHKALGLRPEDTFAAEMLTTALREDCEQGIADL